MTVIDDFMADSYLLFKSIPMGKDERKVIEDQFSKHRLELMKTKRFVLDDDFVRLATKVSCSTDPKDLLARMGSANLPYESTWIEFDARVKVATSMEMAGDKSPKVDDTVC